MCSPAKTNQRNLCHAFHVFADAGQESLSPAWMQRQDFPEDIFKSIIHEIVFLGVDWSSGIAYVPRSHSPKKKKKKKKGNSERDLRQLIYLHLLNSSFSFVSLFVLSSFFLLSFIRYHVLSLPSDKSASGDSLFDVNKFKFMELRRAFGLIALSPKAFVTVAHARHLIEWSSKCDCWLLPFFFWLFFACFGSIFVSKKFLQV